MYFDDKGILALKPTDMADYDDAKKKDAWLSMARKRLDINLSPEMQKDLPLVANVSEKLLFTSSDIRFLHTALHDLVAVASQKGWLERDRAEFYLKDIAGPFPEQVEETRERIKALPQLGSKLKLVLFLLIALLGVIVALYPLVYAGFDVKYNAENCMGLLIGLASLVAVATFFLSGFDFIATIIVYAIPAAIIGLMYWLHLVALAFKLFVIAAGGLLAWYGLSHVRKQLKLLSDTSRRIERIEALAAIRADVKKLRKYGDALMAQTDRFIGSKNKTGSSRDEFWLSYDKKDGFDRLEIDHTLEQAKLYKREVDRYITSLEDAVPGE